MQDAVRLSSSTYMPMQPFDSSLRLFCDSAVLLAPVKRFKTLPRGSGDPLNKIRGHPHQPQARFQLPFQKQTFNIGRERRMNWLRRTLISQLQLSRDCICYLSSSKPEATRSRVDESRTCASFSQGMRRRGKEITAHAAGSFLITLRVSPTGRPLKA
jgi:hypothetical protein